MIDSNRVAFLYVLSAMPTGRRKVASWESLQEAVDMEPQLMEMLLSNLSEMESISWNGDAFVYASSERACECAHGRACVCA